jgi:regulator of cell morphogenesis and NO signaling
METIKTTLAKLATENPAASRVLHGRGLDYCCGGQRSLEDACKERGLDPEEILGEIEGQTRDTFQEEPWTKRPLGELTQFIVERYHETLRRELPELIALAEKVERKHAEKASCPVGLTAHLRGCHAAILDHLEKEEQILFPLVSSGMGSQTAGPVQVMEDEHREHALNLQRTRELTHDFSAPDEACTSWRALYLRLHELEAELMEHIHLENNVLFPRALCE